MSFESHGSPKRAKFAQKTSRELTAGGRYSEMCEASNLHVQHALRLQHFVQDQAAGAEKFGAETSRVHVCFSSF